MPLADKEGMMNQHTPENAPTLTLFFEFTPGQPLTRHQPGYSDDVEITDIKENGKPVSSVIYDALMEQHADKWCDEILAIQKTERLVSIEMPKRMAM